MGLAMSSSSDVVVPLSPGGRAGEVLKPAVALTPKRCHHGAHKKDTSVLGQEKRSRDIDARIRREFAKQERKIKLLVTGTRHSGKSTFLRCVKGMYGGGGVVSPPHRAEGDCCGGDADFQPFTLDECRQYKRVILQNVVDGTRRVLLGGGGIPHDAPSAMAFHRTFSSDHGGTPLNASNAHIIRDVWAQMGKSVPPPQAPNEDNEPDDNVAFFVHDLERIVRPDYVPDLGDVLRARHVQSGGVICDQFTVDGIEFEFIEVRERIDKHTAHFFDNVTAIILVLSVFDVIDDARKLEALELFRNLATQLPSINFIVFVNKHDLVNDDAIHVDAMQVVDEWLREFAAREHRRTRGSREVYHYFTNSTDPQRMMAVFEATKDIVLRDNLRASGFME